jgi:GH24 family phage-related lysozyme (muramidase)
MLIIFYSIRLRKSLFQHLAKIPYWEEMNDNQRGALLSFAYNLGAGFYGGSNFNTITRVLKNKEWNKVPDALYLYRNPGTKVEKGLARRRTAEGKLWAT